MQFSHPCRHMRNSYPTTCSLTSPCVATNLFCDLRSCVISCNLQCATWSMAATSCCFTRTRMMCDASVKLALLAKQPGSFVHAQPSRRLILLVSFINMLVVRHSNRAQSHIRHRAVARVGRGKGGTSRHQVDAYSGTNYECMSYIGLNLRLSATLLAL